MARARRLSAPVVSICGALCLLSTGCSSERIPVNEKPVVPVSGVVHVNGAPVAGVDIQFHPDVPDESHKIFPKATTDAEGKFQAWSYRVNDGLAAGNYTLTFVDRSGPSEPFQRKDSKPDLFKGRYANPKRSEIKLTVPEESEPIDMGTIELTRP